MGRRIVICHISSRTLEHGEDLWSFNHHFYVSKIIWKLGIQPIGLFEWSFSQKLLIQWGVSEKNWTAGSSIGLIQREMATRIALYVCNVDFSIAFDIVNRHMLFYKIIQQGRCGKVIDTLRNFCNKTYLRQSWGWRQSPFVSQLYGWRMSLQRITRCIDVSIIVQIYPQRI